MAEPFIQTTMPNGMPLFIVSEEAALEEVDKLGIPVYYVLASKEFDNGETLKYKREEWVEPILYKRVRTTVGHGLLVCKDASRLPLATFKDAAFYTLPRVPLEMVERMDAFFRKVHETYKSEAIVLLTFDKRYLEKEDLAERAQGWGVLVPDQQNNAAACHYEPDSVVGEYDEEFVDIVGSAHSHPNMSAYASHTDVGDQMDFDGLHVTFGWMASKGNKTEYHCEFQLSNERYTLGAEKVFETIDAPEVTGLDPWLDKVSFKPVAAPKPVSVLGSTSSASSSTGGSTAPKAQGSPSASAAYSAYFKEKWNTSRPVGCPDLIDNVVIAKIFSLNEKACPVCHQQLSDTSIQMRRCSTCFVYFLLPNEEPKDIIAARQPHYNNLNYAPGLEFLSGKSGDTPVVLWKRPAATNAKDEDRFELIWEPPGKAQAGQHNADRRIDSNEFIECAACHDPVPFGAGSCPTCWFQYPKEYWDEEALNKGINIDEVGDDDSVYADAKCMLCINCFTSDCKPYTTIMSQDMDAFRGEVNVRIATACDDFMDYDIHVPLDI